MEITKHIIQYRKDLEFKNYAKSSIENYVSQVTGFLYSHENKFTDASRINESAIKDWLMTHMVEGGVDINLIQKLLGHNNVKTTNIYLHISHNHISKIQSPLQAISL